MDAQFEDGHLLAFNRADLNLVGVIHKGFAIASTSSFMVRLGARRCQREIGRVRVV